MIFDPSRIIWSADVDRTKLIDVIQSGILPKELIIKLDQVYFEDNPKSDIELIQRQGYPVFVDRKISEIPTKAAQIAEKYAVHHPFMLNCMAGICSNGKVEGDPKKLDGLKQFADVCHEYDVEPCGVTVLTSKDNTKNTGMVFQEFRRTAQKQVTFYAKLMVKMGFTQIVCSAQEASYLLTHSEFYSLKCNTPGIRLSGTDIRDQSRIMTPAKALASGIHRIVIGSNITDGPRKDSDGNAIPGTVDEIATNIERLKRHIESYKED